MLRQYTSLKELATLVDIQIGNGKHLISEHMTDGVREIFSAVRTFSRNDFWWKQLEPGSR
jgi:hypothetical protein